MFFLKIVAYVVSSFLVVLALAGCYQRVYTGDIAKAIYACGSAEQVEYISESTAGDTGAKCTNQKGSVNLDQVTLPRR